MRLRPANPNDIDFIVSQEARDEFGNLILGWSRDKHIQNLHDPDKHYLIIENGLGEMSGYAIKSCLKSPNQNVELTRIVIAQPGQGYGKSALQLIIKKVFESFFRSYR